MVIKRRVFFRITEASESATRLGVFKSALSAGKSVEEAALISRRASIDFARMGETMQLINLWVPFVNARLQGTLSTFSALRKNPSQFALAVSGTIGVPALLTYANNLLRYPQVWDDLRDFEKENNFLFIYGDNVDERGKYTDIIKMPKGDIGKILTNPIESFIEFARGNDPKFLDLLQNIVADISPIGARRNPIALSSILPTPIKAAVEAQTNRNLFTNLPIVPRRLEKSPAREQFDEDTSSLI